jgi:hypothetical protein
LLRSVKTIRCADVICALISITESQHVADRRVVIIKSASDRFQLRVYGGFVSLVKIEPTSLISKPLSTRYCAISAARYRRSLTDLL